MNFKESFLTAIGALLANKLRAFLTMLGIIIGVGAVIIMMAIGEGAQEAVMKSMQSMGSDLIFVMAGSQSGGGSIVRQSGSSVRLKLSDAEAIKNKSINVAAVIPEVTRNAQVKYENKNWNTRIVGTTPEFETVRNFPVIAGRYFTNAENVASSKVAVIGANIVDNLFANVNPVGKVMRISGQSFTVVGVLESKGGSGWQNPDDQIIVPINTAQRRIFGIDYLNQISVKVVNQNVSEEAFLDIENILRKEHKLREDQDNDFRILNQTDLINTMKENRETLTFLLTGIAAVSLLVGGIGIMNIMIVSVTERTKEIGIRKAIGARKYDVLSQFLIESVLMSVLGGIIGIVLGVSSSLIIASSGKMEPVISYQAIGLSFLFASFVGIFFGMYPAWKAAKSNVIDALRYE